MAEVIKIGMDVADVKTGIQEFRDALSSGVTSTIQFAEAAAKYNKNGEEVSKTIKGLAEDGTKYEATLKKVAGGYELVNEKVTAARNALKAVADAQDDASKKAQQAADRAERQDQAEERRATKRLQRLAEKAAAQRAGDVRGFQAESIVDANFDVKSAASDPLKASIIEAAIQRIKRAVADGSLSIQRFNELVAAAKADPKAILLGATPNEAAANSAIRTIQQKTPAAGPGGPGGQTPEDLDKTAKAAENAKGVFISLGGALRLVQALILKRIFATLEAEILGSIQSAAKLSIAIAEIRTISSSAQQTTEAWNEQISALSKQFGNSQADVAEATYQTVSNQIAKGAEATEFLSKALQFGAATVTTAADSVNLLSSAMKSFGIDASRTEEVSSIFFKTIELGRVRGKEMAETFGRIGAPAAELGIKLEEVGAAIATITVKGVKFSEASTLISNLIQKLIRPTSEMKALFAEWGVSTGQAAIATFGFEGVLQKLDVEAQKGTARIGELGQQIRAIRAIINLTGNSFQDFQSNLSKITNGTQEYSNAIDEVMNSFGKRAEIQLNKIKVLFVDDFGTGIGKGLVVLAENFGGADNAIKSLVSGLTLVVKGFVAYKAGVLLSAAANVAFTATAGGMSASILAIQTRIAAVNPVIAGFIAGFALGEVLQNLNKIPEKIDDIEKAYRKAALAQKETKSEFNEKSGDQAASNSVKEEFDRRYRFALQFGATSVALAAETKKRTIDGLKDTTDALKISSKTLTDFYNQRLSDIRRQADEARSAIRQSQKFSEDLPRQAGTQVFAAKEKFASDGFTDPLTGSIVNEQKTELIKNRIKQLQQFASTEEKKGTKESLDEARKLYGDIEKLQVQLFEKQTENEKRSFEARIKLGLQGPTSFDSAGNARYEFTARTAELEKTINKTLQERLAFEERVQAIQRAKVAEKEKEALVAKENIRLLQQQFAIIEKIDINKKDGTTKDEFKKDASLAIGQFDEAAAKIKKLTANDDPVQQFQVFSDLQKQREALVKTVNATLREEDAKTAQQSVIVAKKADDQKVDLVDSNLARSRNKIREAEKDLEAILSPGASLDKAGQKTEDQRVLGPFKIPLISSLDKNAETKPLKDNVDTARAAAEAAKALFADSKTLENAQLYAAAINDLTAATKKYIEARQGQKVENLVLPGDTVPVATRLNGANDKAQALVDATAEKNQQYQSLEFLKQNAIEFGNELSRLPQKFQQTAILAGSAGIEINATLNRSKVAAEDLVQKLIDVNAQLESIKRGTEEIRGKRAAEFIGPLPDAGGNFFGGNPKYYANGGPVNWKPRGSDNIPAMLGADETVMTGQASKTFAPILRAMNAGARSISNTGGSTTNVGDITMNIQGGDTSSETLRNVAAGLRRGIRRGTISLQ